MPYDAPPSSLLAQHSDELRDLVARVAPAIVSVGHRRGQGSGFVLTPDGMLVTNHHVIAGAGGPIGVGLSDGSSETAVLIGLDPATDLAVLQIARSGLGALPLVKADEVAIGRLGPVNAYQVARAGICLRASQGRRKECTSVHD